MQLSEVVENLNITQTLQQLIERNSLKQTVVFECDDFVLLDAVVESLCVKMLSNPEKVRSKLHPDLFFYPEEGGKALVVEDVQKIINESLIKPIECDRKIFIIKNTNGLSSATQNKLLKTFEEPNGNVFYFLLTRSLNGILPTILSRALKIKISNLTEGQFLSLGFSKQDFLVCSGNLERMQNGESNRQLFENCKKALKILNSSENLLYVSREMFDKKDAEQIIENLNAIFSKMIEEKIAGEGVFVDIFPLYSLNAMARILEHISTAKGKIKFNCNMQSVLDCLFLKIIEERVKWAKEN